MTGWSQAARIAALLARKAREAAWSPLTHSGLGMHINFSHPATKPLLHSLKSADAKFQTLGHPAVKHPRLEANARKSVPALHRAIGGRGAAHIDRHQKEGNFGKAEALSGALQNVHRKLGALEKTRPPR